MLDDVLLGAHDWELNAAAAAAVAAFTTSACVAFSCLFCFTLNLTIYTTYILYIVVFCSFAFVSIIFLLAELNEPSTNDCFNIRTAQTRILSSDQFCVLVSGNAFEHGSIEKRKEWTIEEKRISNVQCIASLQMRENNLIAP